MTMQEIHVLKISAFMLVYSPSYSILKNASAFGQIAAFTISVFLSDIVKLLLHIIDNSSFESTSNHDFLEKKCFGCKICAH